MCLYCEKETKFYSTDTASIEKTDRFAALPTILIDMDQKSKLVKWRMPS